MSQRSGDILKLFASEHISFTLWVIMLNYFKDHKDQLDLEDVKLLVDKCEECRLYLNKTTCSGKIEQDETFPNIYVHLENIRKQTRNPHYNEVVMVGTNV